MSKDTRSEVVVIGAGLAGCEAAWQLAERGVPVRLLEMKPERNSPAHRSPDFAELVCSNSLGSNVTENGKGLLKEELRIMGSLVVRCADLSAVPAGGALAVDRERFSALVTKKIREHQNIEAVCTEVIDFPQHAYFIVATGPLTGRKLSEAIAAELGQEQLFFYDAAAPILSLSSIDESQTFRASRYGHGDDDYINCPMDETTYECFVDALLEAETAQMKEFEDLKLFEGCMPVENMAHRGRDTLRFGPMKPKGLVDPATGREPYAVVQLRQDNAEGTRFNMVGFQTRLKQPEQRRVFGMIPGLRDAEFLRYGMMHRNTFIRSPGLLDATYSIGGDCKRYFAGQITGVEGYVESVSSGFVAGLNAAQAVLGRPPVKFPTSTMIGALANHAAAYMGGEFQPMNANFGILDIFPNKPRTGKRERYIKMAERALCAVRDIQAGIEQIPIQKTE